jgi:hypothetical protein
VELVSLVIGPPFEEVQLGVELGVRLVGDLGEDFLWGL